MLKRLCGSACLCAQAYSRAIHADHPLILTPLLAWVLLRCKLMCQVDFSGLLRVCCSVWASLTHQDNYQQGTRSRPYACTLLFCQSHFFPVCCNFADFSNKNWTSARLATYAQLCPFRNNRKSVWTCLPFFPSIFSWHISYGKADLFLTCPKVQTIINMILSSICRNMAEFKLPSGLREPCKGKFSTDQACNISGWNMWICKHYSRKMGKLSR